MTRLLRSGLLDDVLEFLLFYLVKVFAALFQGFECFDHRLGHSAMGFFGSSDDGELRTGGDTFMPVFVVEAYAYETGFRFWLITIVGHAVTVFGFSSVSSGISSTASQMMSSKASSCLIRIRFSLVSSKIARKVDTRKRNVILPEKISVRLNDFVVRM